MQTVAPLYPKCAISQTMKSRKTSAPVQCQARFDLNFEENFFDIRVILIFFCDKGMAIPQIKFGFFLAFKQPNERWLVLAT